MVCSKEDGWGLKEFLVVILGVEVDMTLFRKMKYLSL